MPSHLDFVWKPIVDRLLLPTSISWTQFGTRGLAPNAFFFIFWELDFRCDFGANVPPAFFAKSTNIVSKLYLGRQHFFDQFSNLYLIFIWFWKPTRCHVVHILPRNGEALCDVALFFVRSLFFFGFLAVLAAPLAPFGLDYGGVGARFWRFRVPIFFPIFKLSELVFSTRLALCWNIFSPLKSGAGWAGGVTRSAKDYYFY